VRHGIVLNPKTDKALQYALSSEMHALLLVGELGAGKRSTAEHIAATALELDTVRASAGVLRVVPDGQSTGIEQIRQLQQFLQLKTPGKAKIRRAVIIENAETMTTEAQNAFLKVLEEPPLDTIIIMTTARPARLKATIHSRVQSIRILPPGKDHVTDYFVQQGYAQSEIAKNYTLTNGQMGLMSALLSGENEELAAFVEQAKQLYTTPVFERLAQVDTLSKNREDLPKLLYACKRICSSALEGSVRKSPAKAKAWHARLKRVVEAEESLSNNPNTKLLLTDLLLNI